MADPQKSSRPLGRRPTLQLNHWCILGSQVLHGKNTFALEERCAKIGYGPPSRMQSSPPGKWLFLKSRSESRTKPVLAIGIGGGGATPNLCTYVPGSINSHYFHTIGDGHQPNSRGLYTHYKDSY